MKTILRSLILCLLMLLPATVSAERAVNCYWQLEAIETDSQSDTTYGSVSIVNSASPYTQDDPAVMIDVLRDPLSISLDLVRSVGGYKAHSDYTLSGLPVLVPGAASAQLTVTAYSGAEEHSFYLYGSLFVNGDRIMRVRNTGVWVQRVSFPRRAIPGTERRITLDCREIHRFATSKVTYIYRAYPGIMVLDPQGDTNLYDLDGNLIRCLPQTLDDILPTLILDNPNTSSDSTIFSADLLEDGSLVARFDTDSTLTEDELIRLIHAATVHQPETSEAPASVPVLAADAKQATLYLAPQGQLSDDVLRTLIRGAKGQAVSVEAVQESIESGEMGIHAEPTATPAPLTYAQLKAVAAQPELLLPQTDGTEDASDVPATQALVLYNEEGIQALSIAPQAELSSQDLETLIEKLHETEALQSTFSSLFGEQADIPGMTASEKSIELVPSSDDSASLHAALLGDSTLLSVQEGKTDALLAQLDSALIALSVTPTPAPTATPTATPTAEPTATPTAEPTATPTAEPTATPTAEPTATPTAEPTATPTAEPTATPTAEPTATPTVEPTATPTAEPTATPTAEPTATPTVEPTATPTAEPTATPTAEPTVEPTAEPTVEPTAEPTSSFMASYGFLFIIALILLLILIVLFFLFSKKGNKAK